MDEKVIAAVSTAPGPGLRSVVRMSGRGCLSVAARLVEGGPDPASVEGFRAPRVVLRIHGHRVPARMLVFRAPRSFTREDTVEFHLPGGAALAEAVFRACLDAGARPAGPGEFTRRALRNGRIGPAQVEGILALVESRSEAERAAAVRLLQGEPDRLAARVRNDLLEVLSALEAYLDFEEEDTEALSEEELRRTLQACRRRLDRMARLTAGRRPVEHLPSVVILGPPNAGKSTLFRALVPSGRALVSPAEGTTRDLLEGRVRGGKRAFLLYDAPGTAGRDPLERLACSRLAARMSGMDGAVLLFDGTRPPDPRQWRTPFRLARGLPRVVAVNKCDARLHPGWRAGMEGEEVLFVSARKGTGLDRLLRAVETRLPAPPPGGGARPRFLLEESIDRARAAIRAALEGDWHGGLELVALELREAREAVSGFTRRVTDEEILDRVFSRFCIGK